MESLPSQASAYFARQSARIGPFDFASARLSATIEHVRQLQQTVHGAFLDGIADGRFTLLNREIDFGDLAGVEWRRELGEKNNRLWRMNLSYMGYLVPFVERHGAAAVPVIGSLIASMTAQNPWSSRGVFRDVWHPYSASHRVINLIACLSLLESAGVRVDPAVKAAVEAEIRLGAAFVLDNLERDLQFNHLFKNFVCLAVVKSALATPSRFAEGPLDEVARSIAQQFLSDGGHAERAPMYHLLSLLDLRVLRDSGVLRGESATAVARTATAAEKVVNVFVHADGDVALFNDSWLGEAPRAIDLTDAIEPQPASPVKIERPAVGYARLAQGGDGLVLDYGPCGPDANPGHAHADFLSFELSVDGVRTIVDPGVPTYSEGAARDVSRSAASHNGPCLVGAEPIEFWSSFRVGRRGYAYRLPLADDALAVAGWQDGYAPQGLKVARAVRLYPGRGLLVADVWQGTAGLPERSNFTFTSAWKPGDEAGHIVATDGSGRRLDVSVLKGTAEGADVASYCRGFGETFPGTRFSYAPAAGGSIRPLVLWFSWGADGAPPTSDADQLLATLTSALSTARPVHAT